jgi:predicted DNA-binding protein (MmcQ/YjbR family)
MDGQELQDVADAIATGLPDVTLEHRVNPNWDVYKVRGKVFMLMTDMPGRPVVILKADPNDAVTLREQHPGITAGYHMNKTHWITADAGTSLDETLVNVLVTESYRLVAAKLPKSLKQ